MVDLLSQSIENTVQPSVVSGTTHAANVLMFLSRGGDIVPGWWSLARDVELRKFWKRSDHLSGAMYTMIAKLTTIPLNIVARDMSIKSHVQLAEEWTKILLDTPQFGEGWEVFYSSVLEDLLGQDNGCFFEIIGRGEKDQEIVGMPITIAHLDSQRCTRTRNPIYPVIYNDLDGRMYKLHYTRVAYSSTMPSAQKEMNGVGFCSVSKTINAAQNLIDISTYKQEKLGSRPKRAMFITKGGLDPEDIQAAISASDESMNAQGLSRFSKTIAIGNRNIPNAGLDQVDLASIPDGFNEKESTILGMAVIALGFGMDARELFPGMEGGASKADAIISHIKQRGKGPGQIIGIFERLLNQKYLPPFLMASFDYQDDSQDRQVAEIRNIRSQSRERNVKNQITTTRVERQNMMLDGEITKAQFEELELEDGRLDNGVEVDVLFQSDDKDFKEFLSGVTDANYENKEDDIGKVIMTSKDVAKIKKARQALAAIKKKFEDNENDSMPVQNTTGIGRPNSSEYPSGKPAKPDTSYQNEKIGRKLPRDVAVAVDETQNYQEQ